jgi:hypothetical protein
MKRLANKPRWIAMRDNEQSEAAFGPVPVRRVLMPKFEFALEKYLEDRRKRSRSKEGMAGNASCEMALAGEGTAPSDRTLRTF